MNYHGKHAFIAGGSSGVALAIAQALASAGARVSLLSRQQQKIDAALATLETPTDADSSSWHQGHAADVRDAAAVGAALAQASLAAGPVDVLVCAAAGNFVAAAQDLSPNGFKTVVDIDLLGTFNVMRAAWPHLRKPGAALLSISAAQSWLPMEGQVHVCAAKAGVDQVMRTLALEWGPLGVRVNSIAPGPVEGTEGMARLAPTPDAVHAWTQAVPLRRFARRDDIARAALWLCSDEASYVTGVVLSVDGGLSLGGSSAIAQATKA